MLAVNKYLSLKLLDALELSEKSNIGSMDSFRMFGGRSAWSLRVFLARLEASYLDSTTKENGASRSGNSIDDAQGRTRSRQKIRWKC